MKKNIIKIVLLSLVFVLLFGTVSSFAYESYETYTYSIDGEILKSPTAYSASVSMNSYDMKINATELGGKVLSEATDIFADHNGRVYVADKGNDRIVVLNKYYTAIGVIGTYIDEYGRQQSLKSPQGLYVTKPSVDADAMGEECFIYVCDTGNRQVVVFDYEWNYYRTIKCPDTPLLDSSKFTPEAIAVDKYGRIFIVSQAAYEGVIVLSNKGEFTGFIGAQKVSYSLIQMIWRRFQTKEQIAAQDKNISYPYNNITVDDDGFIYVTTDKVEPDKQLNAIRSKSSDFSPVKKLNSTGVEIMKRTGFFDPGGEVIDSFNEIGVSQIIDVALGKEGTWTLLDAKRSRLYTYDNYGNLLFAFGDMGDQLGNGESFVGLTYQEVDGVSYMLLLDNTASGYKITVYSPTDYCDTIMAALKNQNDHNYSQSITYWQSVLTKNNNFDLAYIGIGKALYSQGNYEEALEMLQRSFETTYASKAFAEIRKGIISKWVLPIVAGVIVLLVLLVKFLGYAKKKNKITTLKVGRKTYWEELLFAFHLVFHPFDGFWDLKHEKRGSVRAGSTIMGITIIAFFYNSIGKGYLHNVRGTYSTIFVQILSIAVPVFLWAVANWCLTTLFDGEGSFKDIYIATTYSLAPLPLFVVISTVLTNVLTKGEGSMVSLLITIGFIWVVMLLFFGMLVTHDYSMGKNVITALGTIVAMAVIMFVAILFSSLVVKMVTFLISLISEIGNRV